MIDLRKKKFGWDVKWSFFCGAGFRVLAIALACFAVVAAVQAETARAETGSAEGSEASPAPAHEHGRFDACKADREKFCAGKEPGEGLRACMKENESKLSAACKEQREKRKDRVEDAIAACSTELEKFCKDVKPGKGGKLRCLKKHKSELSEECRAALPKRR